MNVRPIVLDKRGVPQAITSSIGYSKNIGDIKDQIINNRDMTNYLEDSQYRLQLSLKTKIRKNLNDYTDISYQLEFNQAMKELLINHQLYLSYYQSHFTNTIFAQQTRQEILILDEELSNDIIETGSQTELFLIDSGLESFSSFSLENISNFSSIPMPELLKQQKEQELINNKELARRIFQQNWFPDLNMGAGLGLDFLTPALSVQASVSTGYSFSEILKRIEILRLNRIQNEILSNELAEASYLSDSWDNYALTKLSVLNNKSDVLKRKISTEKKLFKQYLNMPLKEADSYFINSIMHQIYASQLNWIETRKEAFLLAQGRKYGVLSPEFTLLKN